MDRTRKLYIAGHTGLFGSSFLQKAEASGYKYIITKTHRELDLTRQGEKEAFFREEKPEYVIMAAVLAGGIGANSRFMADFCMENLQMSCNVIHAAHASHVKNFCIWVRHVSILKNVFSR